MMRIVAKLVTKAKKAGHWVSNPWNSGFWLRAGSNNGSFRFRTRSVMANAMTPSLNASVLPVSL